MTGKVALGLCVLVVFFGGGVWGAGDENKCGEGGNCEGNQTLPFIQEVTTTAKPSPSENTTTVSIAINETTTNNSTKAGRALNFTIHDLNSSMQKLNKHKDLSDVSMDDEDADEGIDIEDHDSLDSKRFSQTNTSFLGICEKGGLTYENGERLENGCDSVCVCKNGKMECGERCTGAFFKKGKKLGDPLCRAKDADDPCCSVMVCAADTETEPLELCLHDNKTYNRGDIFHKGCSELCTCEAAGRLSCKPRCTPIEKTSDRCVEVADPQDSCCKKLLCDVTLADQDPVRIASANFANDTAIRVLFEGGKAAFLEVSDDGKNWKTVKVGDGGVVSVLDKSYKFVRLEDSNDVVGVASEGCSFKGRQYKVGEEFNDGCESFCVCKPSGVTCLKLECPTYFGTDVMDPNCIQWETVPKNFTPVAPKCCPEKLVCVHNGSCEHEGVMYQNWQQLPVNVTGCEKSCYCEMGKVQCQSTCTPVTAMPPPDLGCPVSHARVGKIPGDDCCKYWVCDRPGPPVAPTTTKTSDTTTDASNLFLHSTKAPSRIFGPLIAYTNPSPPITTKNKTTDIQSLNPDDILHPLKKPIVPPEENPYYHHPKFPIPNLQNVEILVTTPKPKVTKHNKNKVAAAGGGNRHQQQKKPLGLPEELLHIFGQHPQLAGIPHGSIVEVHNVPPNHPAFLDHILQGIHQATTYNDNVTVYPGDLGGHLFPGGLIPNIPDYAQQQEEVEVLNLDAVDPYTVRLTFSVPRIYVGLHGRVEVRYTHRDDTDPNSWELQIFAPPNDLIATPQLEFDLRDLHPDTEYRIRITITLRDLHNTPTSRTYSVRTPPSPPATTAPPLIPIAPDLAVTDVNATWATVSWRKLTQYELQFVDGVQLRFKEVEGKIYAATPLIHRAVTSYTLENLKADTKYELGIYFIPFPGQMTELHAEHMLHFTTGSEVDAYGFNVSLEVVQVKPTSVEVAWSGVPYPEDKYVNIYRAIYQSEAGKGDSSTFKIAKRDSPTRTVIVDLKPGTRYRLWLEVYLTNGKIKTSNVQDFVTKPRLVPALGAASHQGKLESGEYPDHRGDYYGPLVIVAILAAIAILSTLILLLILVRRHGQNKAAITPPTARISQSAYDNPSYKVEIQQETMGL